MLCTSLLLFNFQWPCYPLLADSLTILPHHLPFVNTFFEIFSKIFLTAVSSIFCGSSLFSWGSFIIHHTLSFVNSFWQNFIIQAQCSAYTYINGKKSTNSDRTQNQKTRHVQWRFAGVLRLEWLIKPKSTDAFASVLFGLVGQQGLEPRTNRLWAGCSNQLSYWPKSATHILYTTLFILSILFKNIFSATEKTEPWIIHLTLS